MNRFSLEMFTVVVETRRLTTAAKVLNITQPAVSHQIRQLESYFGVPLLVRGTSGVLPTAAGEILYRHGKQILGQFDCLEREIDDLTNADEREIVVGATPTVGNYALPCSLWTFRDRFPKANLRLDVGNSADLSARLLGHSVHLAVLEGPVPEQAAHTSGMKCRCISSDPLVFATPARAAWDKGRLTQETLKSAPLILPARGMGILECLEAALAERGLSLKDLNVRAQLGGLDGMKSAAESHGGVLVCTRLAVQKELHRGAYRDITPDILRLTVPVHLLYHEEALPPVARRFIRFIAAPEEMASCSG